MSVELTPQAERERVKVETQALAIVASTPIDTFPMKTPGSTRKKLRTLVRQYRHISAMRLALQHMEALHLEMLESIPVDDIGDERLVEVGPYCVGRHPDSGKVRIFPAMQPSKG